jgi:uncharacterized protein
VGLAAHVADVDPLDRTPDQTAIALAASAIDYHRREAKTFWQEHFDRLRDPVDDWADTRDVLVVERASVERDWDTLPRARSQSRELRLSGTLAPGSRLRPGGTPHLVYDDPLPPSVVSPGPGSKGASSRAVIMDVWDNGDAVEVLVKEGLPVGGEPHHEFPVALAPSAPPRAKPQPEAIAWWGQAVLDELPATEVRQVPWMARVVDVERAFAARGFAPHLEIEAVVAVTDDVVPANSGRWHLRVSGGEGTASRVGGPDDAGCPPGPLRG